MPGVQWYRVGGPCGPEPHFMVLIIAAGEGMPAGRPLRGTLYNNKARFFRETAIAKLHGSRVTSNSNHVLTAQQFCFKLQRSNFAACHDS